jgi:hypothetical protein
MHRVKHAWQWLRSLAAKMWQQAHPNIKVASLLKKAKPQQSDLIPTLAILMGMAALGFWQQSFAAALFAGVGLFLLAGIYNNTERMLAVLRPSEDGPHFRAVNASTLAEPTTEDSGALNQAIGCLRPWLANEVSLTEENAKESCAVLLESVAGRARSATNNF